MSKTQGRVDPRVLRTRQLLRDAFITLVGQKRFEDITTQDITEQATLNRATFYLHYRDKNDFLIRSMREVLAELEHNVEVPATASKQLEVDAIIDPLIAVFDHFAQHAQFYYIMLCEVAAPPVINEVQRFIEGVALRWVAHLQPDPTHQLVDIGTVVKFVSTACIGLLRWWLENNMPYPAEQMAHQFLNLISLGVFRSIGLEVPASIKNL